MSRRARKSDCPIHFGLRLFGDAWTLLILRDLAFKGRTRYRDFLHAEERIATNILADRLARLTDEGVVERRMTDGTPEYVLTEKGIDLVPMLVEIIVWSARWDARTAATQGFVDRATSDRAGLVDEIQEKLRARL